MDVFERAQAIVKLAIAGNMEAIFCCVGCLVLLASCYSLFYQYRIFRWPETEGVLDTKGLTKMGVTSNARAAQNFAVAVRYHYTVDGQEYMGSRVSPMVAQASGAGTLLLQKVVNDLADEGGAITVYYNPSRPEKSFLKKPGLLSLGMTLGMMAIFGAVVVKLFIKIHV